METPAQKAVFLERETYRRNRRADSLRLLPVLGIAVLLLPDLLLSDSDVAMGATARWMVYFFSAWAGLIVVAYLLARRVTRDLSAEGFASDTTAPEDLP